MHWDLGCFEGVFRRIQGLEWQEAWVRWVLSHTAIHLVTSHPFSFWPCPQDSAEDVHSLDSCEYIWEAGVGFAHSPQPNYIHDMNR